jgi:hypothetical protein
MRTHYSTYCVLYINNQSNNFGDRLSLQFFLLIRWVVLGQPAHQLKAPIHFLRLDND